MEIIARQIDESDYYVIIIAHRYGSIVGDISYTEKEFEYAISKGIPVYGFVIDESVEPLARNVDKDKAKKVAFAKFKSKVKSRPVSFWKNADDLHGKVSIALMKAFNTNPRTGWVRAKPNGSEEIVAELSRLSKENSDLRTLLIKKESQEGSDRRGELEEKMAVMKKVSWTIGVREEDKETWDLKVQANMFAAFNDIAIEMMDEISVENASVYLGTIYVPHGKTCSEYAPIAHNNISSMFTDFAALDLVEPSKKKHAVSDKNIYWSLTSQGRELLKLARLNEIYATAVSKKEPRQ